MIRPLREAVLGIDLGTGSAKVVAFSPEDLEVAARASAPIEISSPRQGWAETDPERWLEATARAAGECLQRTGNPAIAGAGLAGQMHGVVLCREDGAPTRPAVLWADTRSGEEVARLRAAPDELKARLANPLVTGMAGPTLAWLVRYEPGAIEAARWALQPKDWLRLILTGEAATEPSDASATLLWDLPADRWSAETFDFFEIPSRLTPPLRRSEDRAGTVTSSSLELKGLIDAPLIVGGADTACALFGTDPLPPGTVQISVGTGAQVAVALEAPRVDPSGRTHLYRGVLPGSWYAMGAVQNAGLALERAWAWLDIGWDVAYRLFEEAAPGSGGLTFVPHLSGERTPYVDSALRGGWVGLGLEHTRADLVRSAFEGVAFAIREAVEALRSAGHTVTSARLVGGGTGNPLWRELLAGVLGIPLDAVSRPDATARGAARLACRGLGITTEPAPDLARESVEPSGTEAYEQAFARFRSRVPIRA